MFYFPNIAQCIQIEVMFNCWSSFIFAKHGLNMYQGGTIELAFGLVDGLFLVVWVLRVIVVCVVVYSSALKRHYWYTHS